MKWYYLNMIDWSSCPAVERDPERVSGVWVFRGTRVPTTNGDIDPEKLFNWVEKARRLCAEQDRAEIADEKIGNVLAHAPGGPNRIDLATSTHKATHRQGCFGRTGTWD